MTTKRNANIVSLTKAEKTATISALENQIRLLADEPVSSNPVVNKIVNEQVDTLVRVIHKLAAE
jgi:hypothetical protein